MAGLFLFTFTSRTGAKSTLKPKSKSFFPKTSAIEVTLVSE